MNITQQAVIDFFTRIVCGDGVLLASIASNQDSMFFEQDKHCLVFSLPALCRLLDPDSLLAYHEFRMMLYQSSINSQLAQHGVKIDVYQSNNTVDDNLYCLVSV